jgi:hypothetical protein
MGFVRMPNAAAADAAAAADRCVTMISFHALLETKFPFSTAMKCGVALGTATARF